MPLQAIIRRVADDHSFQLQCIREASSELRVHPGPQTATASVTAQSGSNNISSAGSGAAGVELPFATDPKGSKR